MSKPAEGPQVGTELPGDGAEAPPEFEVPLILAAVFGLPLLATLAWFFLRFTDPRRATMRVRAQRIVEEAEGEE